MKATIKQRGLIALSFLATLGISIGLFFYLNSPRETKKKVTKNENLSVEINEPIENGLPYETVRFNVKDGLVFHRSNGTHIEIPANSIVNKKGEQINGEVEFRFREMQSAKEIFLSGIPMQMKSDRTTHLQSMGMVEMRVFQDQASTLQLGDRIQVGDEGNAIVEFIDPFTTENGRTKRIQARFEEPPKDALIGLRKPVSWLREEKGLFVPVDSVIFTGERRIVFLDEGEDRLRPKEIQIGDRFGDWYLVKSGLSVGDRIAETGVFLLASESRLRSSSYFWSGDDE